MELVRLNPDNAVGRRCAIECLRSVGVAGLIGLTDEDVGNREAVTEKAGDVLRSAGMLEKLEKMAKRKRAPGRAAGGRIVGGAGSRRAGRPTDKPPPGARRPAGRAAVRWAN